MKTEIICILDRSGSMASIKNDAIGGFNTYLAEQQKEEGEATMTLVLFNHSHEVVFKNKPIREVEPLNSSTFVPSGTTALLDAIGTTLNESIEETADKHLVVILTDGEENASKEYTGEAVKKITESLRESGKWEFIYLGANQDAFSVASSMGISTSNSLNFAANSEDLQLSYMKINSATKMYRSASTTTYTADILSKANEEIENKKI
jgi:Mg-chelatase subunit ChlD